MSNARYTNIFRAPRPPVPRDPDQLRMRSIRLSDRDWQFLTDAAAANERDRTQTLRDCIREAMAACEQAGFGVLLPRQDWP